MNALTSLDAFCPDVSPAPPLTGLTFYRDRRERAAALWADVPGEQFRMSDWRLERDCGTICCALGWLAEKSIDGWRFDDGFPCWGQAADYKAAEIYFGLQPEDGGFLFSLFGRSYARKHRATGHDVGEALLAAPYDLSEVPA